MRSALRNETRVCLNQPGSALLLVAPRLHRLLAVVATLCVLLGLNRMVALPAGGWANVALADAEQDVRDLFARWATLLSCPSSQTVLPSPTAGSRQPGIRFTARPDLRLTVLRITPTSRPAIWCQSLPLSTATLCRPASTSKYNIQIPHGCPCSSQRVFRHLVLWTAGLRQPQQDASWTSCSSHSWLQTPRCAAALLVGPLAHGVGYSTAARMLRKPLRQCMKCY